MRVRPRTSRRGRRIVATAAVVAVALASPVSSLADPGEVERTRERLDAARDDAASAEARLIELETEASLAVERYNAAREELDAVRRRMQGVLADIERVEARMAVHEETANDFARELYRNGAAYEFEALLGAGDVNDIQVRAFYLRSHAEAQLEVVDALRQDRTVQAANLSALERIRSEATEAERSLEAEKVRVESTFAAQADELARLRSEVARAEDAHVTAVEEEEARLERERREAEQRARREAEERARREAEARRAAEAEARRRAAAEAEAEERRRRDRESEPEEPAADDEPPPATGGASEVVEAALSQLGKPYRWGGGGPDSYDCSGLTSWAWRHAGVSLPHSSRMQYSATRRVSRADLQPGDLLFFGSPIHHVAMYVGNGTVVEAPYSGASVRLNSRAIDRSDLVGIGRPGI